VVLIAALLLSAAIYFMRRGKGNGLKIFI